MFGNKQSLGVPEGSPGPFEIAAHVSDALDSNAVGIACRGDKSINSHHMGYEQNLLHTLLRKFSSALCWLNSVLSFSPTPES